MPPRKSKTRYPPIGILPYRGHRHTQGGHYCAESAPPPNPCGSDTGSPIPVDRRASRKSGMRNGRNRGNLSTGKGEARGATPYEPPQARSDGPARPPGCPVLQGHAFRRGIPVRCFTSISDINPTVSRYLSTGLGTLVELAILRITHMQNPRNRAFTCGYALYGETSDSRPALMQTVVGSFCRRPDHASIPCALCHNSPCQEESGQTRREDTG